MSKETIKSNERGNSSDNELDQYGVWVSTESDDDIKEIPGSQSKASSSNEEEIKDLNDLLLSIDEEESENDTLYLEEENLDLDLDLGTGDFDEAQNDDSSDDSFEIPSLQDDDEIEINLEDDDLQIPELEDSPKKEDTKNLFEMNNTDEMDQNNDDMELNAEIEEMSFDDIELEADLGEMEMETPNIESNELSMEAKNELGLDEELEIDDELDLDLDDIQIEDEMSSGDLDLSEDISLDLESSDLDLPEPSMEQELSLDDLDDSLPGAQLESNFVQESDIEISDEPLPDLELEETISDDISMDSELELSDFDDVDAVRSDLMDKPLSSKEEIQPMKQEDKSMTETADTPVLSSIERELHAIRSELTDLRKELKKLRTSNTSPDTQDMEMDEITDEESEMSDEEKVSGFFEDDEDETIALTGDELDNILNSAEFTEEAGEPTFMDDSMEMDMPAPELGSAFEDDLNKSIPPIEEISLTEVNDDDEDMLSTIDISQDSKSSGNLDIENELAGIEDLSDQAEDELQIEEQMELEIPEDFDEHPDMEIIEDIPFTSADDSEIESPDLTEDVPYNIKQEIKAVLQYMDQLLDALPQDKIEAFARSEHYETYKKLFEELGI